MTFDEIAELATGIPDIGRQIDAILAPLRIDVMLAYAQWAVNP